jgi:type III secretion protein J
VKWKMWRGTCRLLIAAACCVVLQGCKTELYTNLDERQANEITAALLEHGIPAGRLPEKNNRFTVQVEEGRFAEAIETLKQSGLPRQEFASLGEVFKKDGLVSSPVQERAQMIYALSQELARTVSDIDGVLSARVHVVLPENDPLRQQLVPSSASVFVRYRASAPLADLVPQIKMLVANGIAGLSYDKVSVILLPVTPINSVIVPERGELTSFMGLRLDPISVPRAAWLIYSIIAFALILALLLGLTLWRRRQLQVYPLQTIPAKPL